MKLHALSLRNFRSYRETTTLFFDEFTVLIGRNDIGKSTLLEALDIFFGNRKMEEDDIHVDAREAGQAPVIEVTFSDLPDSLVLDAGAPTRLEEEFLTLDGRLCIRREYGNLRRPHTLILADHPTRTGAEDLHTLSIRQLRQRAEALGVPTTYNRGVKHEIRRAIWAHLGPDLQLRPTAISTGSGPGKDLWEKLQPCLPMFALFQSDRSNLDQDSEIQDPMKLATREVLRRLAPKLEEIRREVQTSIQEIAESTIRKVRQMNPEVASTLAPLIPEPKWERVFDITLTSDGVPLNKRGSGVRRLVLLNFFREEAERKQSAEGAGGVLYAIEEPETAQHPDWQQKLVEALRELAASDHAQVIMTSHSPALAGMAPLEALRFLERDAATGRRRIETGSEENLQRIAASLGVLPSLSTSVDTVRLILCFEGPTDLQFFQHIAPHFGLDLRRDPRLVAIHLGGSTLGQWVTRDYLRKLGKPEVHIYDRDVEKYGAYVHLVNRRNNGSWAAQTRQYEIENYIHPSVIEQVLRLPRPFIDPRSDWQRAWPDRDLPRELAAFMQQLHREGHALCFRTARTSSLVSRIKKRLTDEGARHMTPDLLQDIGALEEVKGWFERIRERL